MKKALFLLALMTTNSLLAAGLSCAQQKLLAKVSDTALFGFNLNELPLTSKVGEDYTKVITKGSCVFQVFYMFDYESSNRSEGWYYPMYVTVDAQDSTIFEESLLTSGIDKFATVQAGMWVMRKKLNDCECSIP